MRCPKRLLVLGLAAFMALASRPVVAAENYLPGDSNGDGVVNIIDAVQALRYVATNGQGAQSLNVRNADISPHPNAATNGDGQVNVADVIAILRLVAGLDNAAKYAAGEPSGGNSGPTGPPLPPVETPGVYLTVQPSRGSYWFGDNIPITVTLVNKSDAVKSWEFPTSCQVDLQVLDANGKLVWTPTAICADHVTQLSLKPGESTSWSYVWEGEPERSSVPPRPVGVYTAKATLNGTDLASSTTFQAIYSPDPTTGSWNGQPTFDLTPGRSQHFVNMTRSGEEVISFLRYEKRGDNYYTVVSQTPDGSHDVLLRLDADGNVLQWAGDHETTRLKLNAKEGETWTLDGGSQAKATLVSRSDTLRTPAGTYTDLLRYEFFVGPDAGWTEWVHPKGQWVGYTRNTIAGPVEFRLGNSDGFGIGIGSDTGYGAGLFPFSVQVMPGEQHQMNLLVVDSTGAFVKELPGTVTWSVDSMLGTIDDKGVFTAAQVEGMVGKVVATLHTDKGDVVAGGEVWVGSVPPYGGGTKPPDGGVVTPPSGRFYINPDFAALAPGATQQFIAVYYNDKGEEQKLDSLKWSLDPGLGTIDANGLLTAATDVPSQGVWGALYAEGKVGDVSVSTAVKLSVGGTGIVPPPPVDPGGPPVSAYRMDLAPRYAYPKPGEAIQFAAKLLDATGAPVPATFEWYLAPDENIGTVTKDGLFTAGSTVGADGPLYVRALVDGKEVLTDYSKVYVGMDMPTPPPPPIDVPPTPEFTMDLSPRYAYPEPGATVQFAAKLINSKGEVVSATFEWYLEPDAKYGTVTKDGLFTASADRGAAGPVYVKAVVDGKEVLTDYSKVMVGGEPIPVPVDPMPKPMPMPMDTGSRLAAGERLAYLDGGTLTLKIPPTFQAEPLIQADIAGSMPDPSWAFERAEVEVLGSTITIFPILKKANDGAVPAVIVPFKTSVVVHGLTSGTKYMVVVRGADSALSGSIAAP